MEKRISVCEPLIGERELEYVTDCVKTNWISSRGKYIDEFEKKFSAYCGCSHGITTTSGTTALHLSLAAIEKEAILATLTETGGNKSETARRLGINRKTLHLKLKRYGLA